MNQYDREQIFISSLCPTKRKLFLKFLCHDLILNLADIISDELYVYETFFMDLQNKKNMESKYRICVVLSTASSNIN